MHKSIIYRLVILILLLKLFCELDFDHKCLIFDEFTDFLNIVVLDLLIC